MTTLLEVKNLVTRFYTQEGVVHAVNGISYRLDRGESMALVGESGCGKSVSALSLLGLVPSPPGIVEEGEATPPRCKCAIILDTLHGGRGRRGNMIASKVVTKEGSMRLTAVRGDHSLKWSSSLREMEYRTYGYFTKYSYCTRNEKNPSKPKRNSRLFPGRTGQHGGGHHGG